MRSITIYVDPEWVNAEKTFGTGIDVCCATKRMVNASDMLTPRPYLEHFLRVSMRTLPRRGRIRRRVLIARSVEYRCHALLLIGGGTCKVGVADAGGGFS